MGHADDQGAANVAGGRDAMIQTDGVEVVGGAIQCGSGGGSGGDGGGGAGAGGCPC